jgi:hypothetical protein
MNGNIPHIEPQACLTLDPIGTVALEAMRRKNWADVAIEGNVRTSGSVLSFGLHGNPGGPSGTRQCEECLSEKKSWHWICPH